MAIFVPRDFSKAHISLAWGKFLFDDELPMTGKRRNILSSGNIPLAYWLWESPQRSKTLSLPTDLRTGSRSVACKWLLHHQVFLFYFKVNLESLSQ